ncbi:hypothetical protein MMC11_004297 [Xylographa trunciseda]|nr:hypothetical protein [Xylographa trunciseda]
MVFSWPWKGDHTSPASFEKTLSTLSNKITKATTKLDSCRQQARRFKALWTLYSSFAYLLYVMIVAFVVGWKNWGAIEYTAVAGGPLIIYAIRLVLATFYDYRITNLQANVNTLHKQRDTTIEKLKAATKYNSTQQLLEKYGGTPSKPKSTSQSTRKSSPTQTRSGALKEGRTAFAPPATANIPGRNIPASLPSTPQRSAPLTDQLRPTPPFTAAADTPPWRQQSSPIEPTAEFAPNAFSAPPQYAQIGGGPKWYDRFMDVLLGEDETLPKNRIVLICRKCRLVNGQAPPGVKQMEDVGTWRCSGCGTMNGEESDAKRLVADIKREAASERKATPAKAQETLASPSDEGDEEVVLVSREDDPESDVTQYSDEDLEPLKEEDRTTSIDEDAKAEKPKRGRPKGSVKKRA